MGEPFQADNERCLFCKADSRASRSREHIIPESLGNTSAVLPRGVVCDVCNNYFARKVEAPFLQSASVLSLRFHQRLQNKRGLVPPLLGMVRPGIPAELCYFPKTDSLSLGLPLQVLPEVLSRGRVEACFPLGGAPPPETTVSRFLAKVALESMAQRVVGYPEGLAYLCDEPQLDELRDHARYGRPQVWPVHIRSIYPADAAIIEDGEMRQIVHESDFLVTPWGEWFHVVVIFGIEFTINLGGPEIDGYLRWLDSNRGVSPLYIGKNLRGYAMPQSVNDMP